MLRAACYLLCGVRCLVYVCCCVLFVGSCVVLSVVFDVWLIVGCCALCVAECVLCELVVVL